MFKVLVILILTCTITYSQGKNTYGVKLGFVNSSINNESDHTSLNLFNDTRLGPSFDIFFVTNLYSHLAMEFDLGFVQKGASDRLAVTTPDQPFGTGEYIGLDYKLDYIKLSSSLSTKFVIEVTEFQPFLGLSSNFLIDDKGFNIDDLTSFNFGYLFGLKIVFNNSMKNPIFLEIMREIDFDHFYKNHFLELNSAYWGFKLGFYYN
ncbi:MAG: hypothetical protein D8M58_04605 [Calditrichaeota bacterium]|nr:MAG: hypothetical protein DWQ03_02470 [Calditrichota bacterium]MBL1204652.1 hypothetical protein [Calditrichota bacterium]NOG44480.1 hypothetical protein [Calditrichota bacterium]